MWNDDMEAAPKDGTKIDLYFPDRGREVDCFYRNVGLSGWVKEHGYPVSTKVFLSKPTHWAFIVLPE